MVNKQRKVIANPGKKKALNRLNFAIKNLKETRQITEKVQSLESDKVLREKELNLKREKKGRIQGNLYTKGKAGQLCTTVFLTAITNAESAAKYYATADAYVACAATTANVSIDGVASKYCARKTLFHLV